MSALTISTFAPFKVWEKIEIVTGEGDQAGHYLARIQDFINGGVVITEPEFIQGQTLLRENAEVFVLVVRDDAIYQFHSIIKRIHSRAKMQFLLTPPQRMERVQRRQFVRIELTKKLSYAKIASPAEWEMMEDRIRWKPTVTSDISGGGLLFKLCEEFDRYTRLLVRLDWFAEAGLPHIVAALSQRCFKRKIDWYCGASFILDSQLSKYFTAGELSELPASVAAFDVNAQNRLVSHIFQLQVAMRQKGLL